ncbi:hypothetical protein [Bacillus massiliigorillae]|uniref:hypothetical protein n=1 Tax=Bacillus massiliigorillae TaxID=1243664 RepID=UPI0003A96DBE|nr:hypothetical protein [Bacillus massiliigorillae]
MKKELLFTAATVTIAAVAVAPQIQVQASSADTPPGFYNISTKKYTSMNLFQLLSTQEKISLLLHNDTYVLVGTNVLQAKHLLFSTDATINRSIIPLYSFETINNIDLSVIANTTLASKVINIKSLNKTTVEVTFSETINSLSSLYFAIEGLNVVQTSTKNTDNKTVILTTALQQDGREYIVRLNNTIIGKFKTIPSAPTSITLLHPVQAQVGKSITLKADIGQKTAGIPITFNIDAPTGSSNKDIIVEILTNAEGIAQYTYTQESLGRDLITVYLTNSLMIQDLGAIYWVTE